jgi:hypothetical protein
MKAQQLLTESFTTKDGYLIWRQAWKLVYKQISDDIRTLKLSNKDRNRNPIVSWDEKSKSWVRTRPWTEAEAKLQARAEEADKRMVEWCGSRCVSSLSDLATQLLARRHWSKEEAQRQYQAGKTVAA